MKSLVLACMVSLIAGQATALSCMRPDPTASFARASASDDTYYVLYGTLDFDASALPQDVENRARQPDPVPAVFRGNGVSKTGFNLRLDVPVTLQSVCAGPWCGTTQPNTPALIFARVRDDQIVVEIGPCGGQVFLEPSQADLTAMTQCMNTNCN